MVKERVPFFVETEWNDTRVWLNSIHCAPMNMFSSGKLNITCYSMMFSLDWSLNGCKSKPESGCLFRCMLIFNVLNDICLVCCLITEYHITADGTDPFPFLSTRKVGLRCVITWWLVRLAVSLQRLFIAEQPRTLLAFELLWLIVLQYQVPYIKGLVWNR